MTPVANLYGIHTFDFTVHTHYVSTSHFALQELGKPQYAGKTVIQQTLPCNRVSGVIISFYTRLYSHMPGIASGPLLQERRKPV